MNYQLSRRYFLRSIAALGLSQLLGGCNRGTTNAQILFLENSIPPQLVEDFRKSQAQGKIDFKPQAYISQIYDSLFSIQQSKKQEGEVSTSEKIFNKSQIKPSLATLGDTWLSMAIAQNLIQPLAIESLANWQKLPVSWQKLVRRNSQGDLANDGAIYGAPYRWGGTLIAYRRDKLDSSNIKIEDWHDLWQPELRDRISLLDSPREVIGLTLKKLGESYNTDDLDAVGSLETELEALHQQTKLYSSDHYLEPLVLGDTWAAVAWSADILPLLKRYPNIEFVVPQSGTSLWADLWVKPRLTEAESAEDEEINTIEEWINYCWQPQAASLISLFTPGISPIFRTSSTSNIPESLQDNVLINSPVLNSDKSEFLSPLKPETERQYRDLWLKIRQSSAKTS